MDRSPRAAQDPAAAARCPDRRKDQRESRTRSIRLFLLSRLFCLVVTMCDNPQIDPAPNLVLIGFMGSGKTTVGKLCAERAGLQFLDTDTLIESRAGCTIAALFSAHGEAAFRALERVVIAESAVPAGRVLATGGGAVLDPANALALRAGGVVFWLEAGAAELLARVGDAAGRPLLDGAADLEARVSALIASRRAVYGAAAHHVLQTDGKTPDAVAEEALVLYKATVSEPLRGTR